MATRSVLPILLMAPGAAADAPAGTYTGSVMVSGATGSTFNPENYAITYVPGDITVYETPVTSLSVIAACRRSAPYMAHHHHPSALR